MPLPRVESCDVKNKRVLIIADFKSQDGRAADPLKIDAAVPTIELLLNRGAAVMIGTHLGLQLNDETNRAILENIGERIEKRTGQPPRIVLDPFTAENQKQLRSQPPGTVVLLENFENFPEESNQDEQFARMLAGVAEVFVNDSVEACLKPYASTTKLPELIPAYAGLSLFREVETFRTIFTANQKPFTMILGGVDLERKIKLVRKLIQSLDNLLIGGGIAYTFLKSRAMPIGNSLFEGDFQVDAFQTLERAEMAETAYQLPVDHIVADQFSRQAKTKKSGQIPDHWQAMDLGPKSVSLFEKVIKKSGTVFWYGSLGVVEFDKFSGATESIAQTLKKTKARTIVTGDSCLKVLSRLNLTEQMDHVGLSSQAAYEILLGNPLPGLQALEAQDA